jgi:hypothetical protein
VIVTPEEVSLALTGFALLPPQADAASASAAAARTDTSARGRFMARER